MYTQTENLPLHRKIQFKFRNTLKNQILTNFRPRHIW